MADLPDPDSPHWFTMREVHERWGFLRMCPLARRKHVQVSCDGMSIPRRGDIHERQAIPADWWAPASFPIQWDSQRSLAWFPRDIIEDGFARTDVAAVYGVMFHVLPHIQQQLDEGREAELDQKPAPASAPAPAPVAPDFPKKDRLDGLAVAQQILAYQDSEHVLQAEAIRKISEKLGAPLQNVERTFFENKDKARGRMNQAAAQSAKSKPKR